MRWRSDHEKALMWLVTRSIEVDRQQSRIVLESLLGRSIANPCTVSAIMTHHQSVAFNRTSQAQFAQHLHCSVCDPGALALPLHQMDF
jgi:hypothetical protein